MTEIDFECTLRALDGNRQLLRELGIMFVEDAPALLAKLKITLNDNQPVQTRAVVHSLKSLISTFFAKTGVEIAQRLEENAATGDLELFQCGELARLESCIRTMERELKAFA